MTQTLSKYYSRSPRYTLQPEDNTLIRVAGPQQTPWEEATEIRNISLSGLAFTAPADLCPMMGELIKIQFEVPGSKQMACYGLVTRLESLRPSVMTVGIEFRKLELPQRIVLAQALAQKLHQQLTEETKKSNRLFYWNLFARWKKVLGALAALGIWGYLFYVLSTIFVST